MCGRRLFVGHGAHQAEILVITQILPQNGETRALVSARSLFGDLHGLRKDLLGALVVEVSFSLTLPTRRNWETRKLKKRKWFRVRYAALHSGARRHMSTERLRGSGRCFGATESLEAIIRSSISRGKNEQGLDELIASLISM